MNKKKIICFMGKSGCGKSTLINKIAEEKNANIIKSYSTRPIRENDDKDIETHTFVNDEVYNQATNIIAYYKSPQGYHYWTDDTLLKDEVANLYAIDVLAFIELSKNENYEVFGIYLDVSEETRKKRLNTRGCNISSYEEEEHLSKKHLEKCSVKKYVIIDTEQSYSWLLEEVMKYV